MIRPRKAYTNRLSDQWEQNLLLKVMERKIRTAKSTIPNARKSQHKRESGVTKPNTTVSLDWNFSDLKRRLPVVQSSNPKACVALSAAQVKPTDLAARFSVKKDRPVLKLIKSSEDDDSKDDNEDRASSTVSGTDLVAEYSDGFLSDDFPDTDDDLLGQLWSSCKQENTRLDDPPFLKQQLPGPTTTAIIYVSTNSHPETKRVTPKQNGVIKRVPVVKKSKAREMKAYSRFMKKRESGWRD